MVFDVGFGACADKSVDKFTVFKEKQCRDTLSRIAHSGHLVFIYIEFYDLNPACIIRGELIEDWRYHAAGTAPGSPAVHHHRVGA
jgi:hypothetical protein